LRNLVSKYSLYKERKIGYIINIENCQKTAAKLEFYRLVGEGYKAMQEGRTSTIKEVREKLNN